MYLDLAYRHVVRPLLFRLSADRAHDLAQAALSCAPVWRALGHGPPPGDPRLATTLCGLPLRSPIGLAAGFDKNCDCIPALSNLGFAYVTVGSLMTEPRPGNPTPRLSRVPHLRALCNAQGLPSKGRPHALARLQALRERPVPLIANLCGFSPAELVAATEAVQPHVDAVEFGLICPHTGDRGGLGVLDTFAALVDGLRQVRRVPMLVKLPLYDSPAEADVVRGMVRLWAEGGLDGLTVGGGKQVRTRRLATGRGSLSGPPSFANNLRMLRDVAEWSAGRLPIKAGGGVFSGDDALTFLRAGATVVEVYTAFVYRGPGVAHALNRELLQAMDHASLDSLVALRPAPQPVPMLAVGGYR